MGVDTWYAFGTQIDETVVKALADAMVSRGLVAAGYKYVWIDAGWWSGTRDSAGKIIPSPVLWPHGLSWLTTYLHHRGMRAGIYTDAGINGCAGTGQGSWGHYQDDINTFALWGFDAVKVDFCGGNQMGIDPRWVAHRFATAIAADNPHRRMLFNFCDGAIPNHYGAGRPSYDNSAYATHVYAAATANSWRTGPDIGGPGYVFFAGMLNNLDWDALWPYAAGPGHWNDPDYLVPDEGMTPSQAQAQFSMWTIVAAPMMLSDNVVAMPQRTVDMAINPELLAISQDRLGVQGWLAWRRGDAELWVRPLADGSRAIALLNRGLKPVSIAAFPAALGLPAAHSYSVRDVWLHRSFTARAVRTRRIPAPARAGDPAQGSRSGAPGKGKGGAPHPTITISVPAPIRRIVPADSAYLLHISAA
jgi:alpha-galactosidase